MTDCNTCAGDSTARDLYWDYQTQLADLGTMQHAKAMLRCGFSRSDDKWTRLDDELAKAMDAMDVVISRHLDRVMAAKQRHQASMELAKVERENALEKAT